MHKITWHNIVLLINRMCSHNNNIEVKFRIITHRFASLLNRPRLDTECVLVNNAMLSPIAFGYDPSNRQNIQDSEQEAATSHGFVYCDPKALPESKKPHTGKISGLRLILFH